MSGHDVKPSCVGGKDTGTWLTFFGILSGKFSARIAQEPNLLEGESFHRPKALEIKVEIHVTGTYICEVYIHIYTHTYVLVRYISIKPYRGTSYPQWSSERSPVASLLLPKLGKCP